jgi:6-phosphofructokinase
MFVSSLGFRELGLMIFRQGLDVGGMPRVPIGKVDPEAHERVPDCGPAGFHAALDRLDARAFVYIGGNDTAGTLELLRQQSTGPCHFVHAPQDHR